MKKLSLIVAFLGLFLSVNAQSKPSFDYYSKETLDAIGTSKEQQAQIAEIRKNSSVSLLAVKNNADLSEEEKKAKSKEIYSERTVLYQKTLTEEQREKLKTLVREFQQKNK